MLMSRDLREIERTGHGQGNVAEGGTHTCAQEPREHGALKCRNCAL